MLYPDLGRLALLCPTGGTNDHEAGGSNDPPRPPPGPAERAVMGDPDLVPLILSAPNTNEACKLAVSWCA